MEKTNHTYEENMPPDTFIHEKKVLTGIICSVAYGVSVFGLGVYQGFTKHPLLEGETPWYAIYVPAVVASMARVLNMPSGEETLEEIARRTIEGAFVGATAGSALVTAGYFAGVAIRNILDYFN